MVTQITTQENGTKKQETLPLNTCLAKHASEKTNELVVQTPAERLLEAKKLLIKGIDSLTPSDICLSDSKQVQGLQILLVDISRNVNMEHLTSGNVVSMNTFAQKMGENMVAKVIMICIKTPGSAIDYKSW